GSQMSTSSPPILAEATPHECWLSAGEQTTRRWVRRDAFDAKRRCLAARPRSMLWPSSAAHGLRAPGRLPPALKRWPEVSQPAGAASERGPDRLSRSPPPRRRAQSPVVPHWELPAQRRRRSRRPAARCLDAHRLDAHYLGRSLPRGSAPSVASKL